jgi:hypothetical protein
MPGVARKGIHMNDNQKGRAKSISMFAVAGVLAVGACDGMAPDEAVPDGQRPSSGAAPLPAEVQQREVIFFDQGVRHQVALDSTTRAEDGPETRLLARLLRTPSSGLIVDGAQPGKLWVFASADARSLALQDVRPSLSLSLESTQLSTRSVGYYYHWMLWEDTNRGGGVLRSQFALLDGGPYVTARYIGDWWNDKASSIDVNSPLGCSGALTAYQDGEWGGNSVTFVTNPATGYTFHNLTDFCMTSFLGICFTDWNDQISSIKWTAQPGGCLP